MLDERAFWLGLMAVAGLFLHSVSGEAQVAARSVATAPSDMLPLLPVIGSKVVAVPRAADGLFYLTGQVNGVRVRFLVDTGATAVVLAPADAARVNLSTDRLATTSQLHTASGAVGMTWAKIDQLEVAGRKLGKTRAALAQRGPGVSLLGQDVLRRLGPVTIDADRLTIAAPTSSQASS